MAPGSWNLVFRAAEPDGNLRKKSDGSAIMAVGQSGKVVCAFVFKKIDEPASDGADERLIRAVENA